MSRRCVDGADCTAAILQSVALDSKRLGVDAEPIAKEEVVHLAGINWALARITLEIDAEVPEGVDQTIVRAVTENRRALDFGALGFEQH